MIIWVLYVEEIENIRNVWNNVIALMTSLFTSLQIQ